MLNNTGRRTDVRALRIVQGTVGPSNGNAGALSRTHARHHG